MILENLIAFYLFFLPRLQFNMRFFFFSKLYIFIIIQQRQAINHCIVCSVGHITLKK